MHLAAPYCEGGGKLRRASSRACATSNATDSSWSSASGNCWGCSTPSKASTTRAAYDLLADGFGPGSNGPLVLVAQQGSPGARPALNALNALVQAVRHTPGVASVAIGPGSVTGGLSVINVVPTSAPQDKTTSTLVCTTSAALETFWSPTCARTSFRPQDAGPV